MHRSGPEGLGEQGRVESLILMVTVSIQYSSTVINKLNCCYFSLIEDFQKQIAAINYIITAYIIVP